MHDDADFLRAILADPFDDAPRLIYAEWLEDRAHESGGGERCPTCDGKGWGDDDIDMEEWHCLKCHSTGRIPDHRAARAEFIRVQCELAKFQTIVKWRNLKNRELELLQWPSIVLWLDNLNDDWRPITNVTDHDGSKNHGGWFNGDQYILTNFHRGFVSPISCTLEAFMYLAAEIFARHPITEVRLTDRRPIRGTLYRYGWYGRCFIYSADDLPLVLFNCLKGHEIHTTNLLFWKWYTSLEAAQLALSHACVDYGRQLVGLPPLNRPPETEGTKTTA